MSASLKNAPSGRHTVLREKTVDWKNCHVPADTWVVREGKHSAKLVPLIDALPARQRALCLHISAEHDTTRGAVAAEAQETRATIREESAPANAYFDSRHASSVYPVPSRHPTAFPQYQERRRALLPFSKRGPIMHAGLRLVDVP